MQLAKVILNSRFKPSVRNDKWNQIIETTLASSSSIRARNFTQISDSDLKNLFHLIDNKFFSNSIDEHLRNHAHVLQFRVSRRMTSSGGITTTKFSNIADGDPKEFEIAISSTLLFESFRSEQPINVTGLLCENRFQALQRIMEHEIIHLIEMLLWNDSSCSAKRFQSIARRFFGHNQSTHQLITPADTAQQQYNIAIGDWVRFYFKDRCLRGYVNRITRRATVLVPSVGGAKYTDGKRYKKYYVPIDKLSK